MHDRFPRRGIRAFALAFLAVATTLAAGCGKDSGGDLTDPPSDPGPGPGPSPGPGPGPGPSGPAPVGDVMYAVDLSNNFLVFGTGSITTPTAKMKITGVPLLKRIIGLAIRPSDGALIGVGNDSRTYTIDPLTAKATPINSTPFSPQIASFFDIHFAMALEPNGQRVRLIAAESGGNWSIDIGDGTATLEPNARYGAGSPLAGRRPALLGVVYPTLPGSAKQAGWCANLAYAIDADEAIVIASCDPATGWWYPTGLSPEASGTVRRAGLVVRASAGPLAKVLSDLKDQLLRCGEFLTDPGGSESDGEEEPPADGGPWFPRSPDTKFYLFLNKVGELQNRAGTVELIDAREWGITWGEELPADNLVQSGVWAVGGPYGPQATVATRRTWPEVQLSAAGLSESSTNPWAGCTGGK